MNYQQQSLAGKNGVELIVALYDGMVRFLYRGIQAIESGDIRERRIAVKRTLDIGNLIPEVSVGMEGAVDYGTARSLHANFSQLPILGKTGTCSNNGTRYGWFASFANTSHGRIVTVFFLEGGRPTFGPKAAELTGLFYRNLWDKSYFAAKQSSETTTKAAIGVTE